MNAFLMQYFYDAILFDAILYDVDAISALIGCINLLCYRLAN